MARDRLWTMSDGQALSVPVGANLAATDSTNRVPRDDTGADGAQHPGNLPPDAVWHVDARVGATAMEGRLVADLQISRDGGATFLAAPNARVELSSDPALSDAAASIVANGRVRRAISVGIPLQDVKLVDPNLLRYKTVYTTLGRVAGDPAVVVNVTSYIAATGSFTGD